MKSSFRFSRFCKKQIFNGVQCVGFTMIEMLVVLALLSVLLLFALFVSRTQISKAQDSRRKSDLQAYKIALEQYFEDNQCYPDESVLEDCGGAGMKPYLPKVMCDPRTKQPYRYIKLSCNRYAMWTKLESPKDKDVLRFSRDGSGEDVFLGFDDQYVGGLYPNDNLVQGTYNYGIASPNLNPNKTFFYGDSNFVPAHCGEEGYCYCTPGSDYTCPATMICDESGLYCYGLDTYIDDRGGSTAGSEGK